KHVNGPSSLKTATAKPSQMLSKQALTYSHYSLSLFINHFNRTGDNTFQRLIDIHHQHILLVGTRLFERIELRHQHLGFKEVTFTRFQAAFDNIEIALQVNKGEVWVTVTQLIAVALFQRGTDDERHFIGALHGESGVVERL